MLFTQGNDSKGGTRVAGLTEEQETRARDKAREDQEVYYSTKQEARKQTYGGSVKWKDEYEWVAKLIGHGGRNLRQSRDMDKVGRNKDMPVEKDRYTVFIEKHLYDQGTFDAKVIKKKQITTLCVVLFFWCVGFGSRML